MRIATAWPLVLLLTTPTLLRAQATSPWGVQLGVEESWNSNVLFATPDDPGDFETHLSLRVRREWLGHRGSVSVSGEGGGSVFAQLTDLNQLSYAGEVTGGWALSPRAAVHVEGHARSSYLGDIAKLTDASALSPLTVTRTQSGLFRFSRELSRRTQFVAEATADNVTFDSASLAGGTTLLGRLGLRRLMSHKDTFGLDVDAAHSDLAGEAATTVRTAVSWERTLRQGLTMTLGAGAARYKVTDRLQAQLVPVASAELERRAQRSSFGVRYSRVVEPSYGLGRVRSSDVGALHWEHDLRTSLSASLVAEYRGLSDSVDPTLNLEAATLTAILKWRVRRDLAVSTSALHRRRFATATVLPISSDTVTIGFAYAPVAR